jgi:hypothetical protein
MDDVVNRFARELADAIAEAVAEDPEVEACRERARAAGYEMHVTLEAVVGFITRSQAKMTEPPGKIQRTSPAKPGSNLARVKAGITPNDGRFLRSLRISSDDEVHYPAEERRAS